MYAKYFDLNHHLLLNNCNLGTNGKTYEKCIYISRDSRYEDINCLLKHCFACKMPTKNIYSLRGKIPKGSDRKYFVSMMGNKTEIRGLKETKSVWTGTSHGISVQL